MTDILFWGRHGNYGPDYPRNRVITSILTAMGHRVRHFQPVLSVVADLEYLCRGGRRPDLVWVPCFRQRDLPAAARYARRQGIPLVFDPLISAYDKQVNERRKFAADSLRARRLLAHESRLFQRADWLVADTAGHAAYFSDVLGTALDRTVVIPVGAEEALFTPQPWPAKPADAPLELTFFGTFIGLQGVDVLAEAIATYAGPPVRWRLVGEGPLKAACEQRLADKVTTGSGAGVVFEGWGPLEDLPARLASSDAILGIFGSSAKAQRVIPNKVYQGLAIGRPVITAATEAYAPSLRDAEGAGFFWAGAGAPDTIKAAVLRFADRRAEKQALGQRARETYERHYGNPAIAAVLEQMLASVPARIE